MKKKPTITYKTVKMNHSGVGHINRLMIATPTTGEVRMEWVMARYGQIIPTNWSQVQYIQFINPYAPQGYLVADAQNIIVKEALEKQFEWLLLVEQDNILPENAMVLFNEHIKRADVPVISGLYFTKSDPSEPLVYRGRGTGAFDKFKIGEPVWADGVPTGCLLINCRILKEMWKDSAEYMAGDVKVRRVFEVPARLSFDPQKREYSQTTGTSDLEWCTRVMHGKYFEKAGWPKIQKKKYPFLVDTAIFCKHIDSRGVQYPQNI